MDVFINRKKLSKGAQVALFELLENFGIRTPRSTVNQMPLLCFENGSLHDAKSQQADLQNSVVNVDHHRKIRTQIFIF